MTLEWLLLAAIAGAVALWVGGMHARENAVHAARKACTRYGVQFLDDTVAMVRMRLARDPEGRVRVSRVFGFEFAVDGDRYHGTVSTLAARITDLSLDMPDYRVYENEPDDGGRIQ